MVMTVPMIGDGSEDSPFRPDTTATWWQVVEQKETEFVIEVFGQ